MRVVKCQTYSQCLVSEFQTKCKLSSKEQKLIQILSEIPFVSPSKHKIEQAIMARRGAPNEDLSNIEFETSEEVEVVPTFNSMVSKTHINCTHFSAFHHRTQHLSCISSNLGIARRTSSCDLCIR